MSRFARWSLPLVALGLLLLYAARRPAPPPRSEGRFLMDTLVTVTVWGLSETRSDEALDAAFAALEAVDREMARIPGTPLSLLNEGGGGRPLPATAEVVEASLAWARGTSGAFDPTVAPLLDLWAVWEGPHPPPSPAQVQEALARVGWQRVRWDPAAGALDLGGTELDLGGIAKGYALDKAAEALRSRGAADFIVNAGGDLFVAGSKGDAPWKVGIQHPRGPEPFLRVVAPREGSLVTSGDYERAYEWEGERYHHVVDPRTGRPARGCRSVTIWAPRAIDADALATAVFVLGPERGMELLEADGRAEGLVVDAAGVVRETPGFGRVAPALEAR